MEIKILDSIIHGSLKPWMIDATNTRRFTELLKAAKAASTKTNSELQSQLFVLLTDFPDLQKVLSAEAPADVPVQQLLFNSQLPKYKDSVTQFYYFIITTETLRVFNSVLQQAANWTDLVDIRYQIGKTLTNIRVLAKQVTTELKEQGFTTVPDENSNHIHYTLHYHKHCLIHLYFSLQKSFENSLQQLTTLDDFYVLDLELPLSAVEQIEFIPPPVAVDVESNEYNGSQEGISFGFKDDLQKLKPVVNRLCFQITLLNEDVCTADDFIKVLTAKNILPGATKIQIGCETKHFRYCIDKFQPYFTELTLANIEKSQVFYSKKDTLIKANNLSASGSKNKLEPKEKATIDKIFKHLQ